MNMFSLMSFMSLNSTKMKDFVLFQVFCFLLLCWSATVVSKECTNNHPQLNSHTIRNELLNTKNETRKKEILSIRTDISSWPDLLARKILREVNEFSWSQQLKNPNPAGDFKPAGDLLKEVSLHDVRLDPNSIQGRAMQTNLEYLLMLNVDDLVWSFRKNAGLETPGKPYGGWEAPDQELRGHFVGHFMSSTAKTWASTHNETIKKRMTAVVSALNECQKKMGTGYLSAFPSEYFDRLEAAKEYVWAPYYTIHKILVGLLDQYTFADNAQALNMAKWMVEYFYNRIQKFIKENTTERHWNSLNEEFGGMNDVLYRLYTITGDQKHLVLAQLFDKPCFLGLLAVQADDISGFHTNTHIPIVIGAQMRYEVTGDPLYKAIGTYFMDVVNSSHAYATGGTSVGEFWSDPKRLADTLGKENEESCTTYNMLKVSRHLFRWTKAVAYADYYERALTNGVLGIQRGTDPGVMIYMLPQGHGVSKAVSYHGWGTPYNDFWCCMGTATESFAKLGDSIYFEEQGNVPTLYIIQYVSSTLNWRSANIILNQKVKPVVSWEPYLHVELTSPFSKMKGKASILKLRIPTWTDLKGAMATLNDQNLEVPAAGSFLQVKWNADSKLTLHLPMTLRTEPIKDDRSEFASLQSILFGPYLLSGYSNGDKDIKTGAKGSLTDWIAPVPAAYNNHLATFSRNSDSSTLVLSNSDQSIKMDKLPKDGAASAVHSTFRLIFTDTVNISNIKEAIGKTVMLEPFDLPGQVIVHNGKENKLDVTDARQQKAKSCFHVVSGLDGKVDSVSLESKSLKGCYIYSDSHGVKLGCDSGSDEFTQSTSFVMKKGLTEYNPISFIAKGATRNFLLVPLQSFRDEFYNIYFNINA